MRTSTQNEHAERAAAENVAAVGEAAAIDCVLRAVQRSQPAAPNVESNV